MDRRAFQLLLKVLIAYETRYGTTGEIALLAEGLAADCDVKVVADVANVDYDLIIVGSPMYADEPAKRGPVSPRPQLCPQQQKRRPSF